ncbi:MAG: hypothetical protein GX542_02095 [Rhodococcus sp.]|nr:hypothetical protein [Rhodococcus sp. (in: high G+C Gram-positive bacteria)]
MSDLPPQYDRFDGQPAMPSVSQGPENPAPVDVQTARHLWWLVALLGLLQGFGGLAAMAGQRDVFIAEFVRQAESTPGTEPEEVAQLSDALNTVWIPGLGLAGLIFVGVTGLFLLLVRAMSRGRQWARMVLTVIGVALAFMALPVLFGVGNDEAILGSTTTLLLGGAQILQAVAAVGAIVLLFRKESTEYFLPKRAPDNGNR